MFNGYSKLITIMGLTDTNNVENMSHMFEGCSSLSHAMIPSLKANKVKDMSFMFRNCTTLNTNTGIYRFDLSNVKNMSYMFDGCTDLKYLQILLALHLM